MDPGKYAVENDVCISNMAIFSNLYQVEVLFRHMWKKHGKKHYLKQKKDQTHPIPSMGLVFLPTFYHKNQPFMSVNIPFVPRIPWHI